MLCYIRDTYPVHSEINLANADNPGGHVKRFFAISTMIVSYVIAFLAACILMMGMSANGWEDDRSVPILWVLSPDGGLLFLIVAFVFGMIGEKLKEVVK